MSHRGFSTIHDKRLCPLVLVLCGCAVGPDFTRPPVKVSQTWLDASNQRVKTEAAEYRNWWQSFNDPILNGLIDRAYRENLSLRIAGVRVLEARAQLGIAVGGLFPQIQQAFGSLQYNRLSERSPLAVSNSNLSYRQSEIGRCQFTRNSGRL
jgi:outer membrane protein TolC